MIPKDSFDLDVHGLAGAAPAKIPGRGLGTFQPDPKVYPEGSVKKSVLAALEAGYRHIDTSLRYENEVEVGEAIRESGVPREDVFLVTKL